MRYINKKGEIIIYKRDYKKERANATGYVNIDTISFDDKVSILSMLVYDEMLLKEILLKTSTTHPHISKRKVKALIRHYQTKEDEYYENVSGFYRRMF